EGGLADFTTVNQKGKLQVNAGGTATNVTLKQGGALVTSTAATVLGSNRLGNFTVENGKADGVVLEGTVAKLAMRQPFVLFKGLTFQKLCL
ncbi:autotransporter adhesin family protein, partial [Escherichia coli]|nr:autotransporter adhesin family protein [Escherichia coli]